MTLDSSLGLQTLPLPHTVVNNSLNYFSRGILRDQIKKHV